MPSTVVIRPTNVYGGTMGGLAFAGNVNDLNEGVDSDDNLGVTITISTGTMTIPMDNMPADFDHAVAAKLRIRYTTSGISDDQIVATIGWSKDATSTQVNDHTMYYSTSGTYMNNVATETIEAPYGTTTFPTYELGVFHIDPAYIDKTSMENGHLLLTFTKSVVMSSDNASLYVEGVEFELTYVTTTEAANPVVKRKDWTHTGHVNATSGSAYYSNRAISYATGDLVVALLEVDTTSTTGHTINTTSQTGTALSFTTIATHTTGGLYKSLMVATATGAGSVNIGFTQNSGAAANMVGQVWLFESGCELGNYSLRDLGTALSYSRPFAASVGSFVCELWGDTLAVTTERTGIAPTGRIRRTRVTTLTGMVSDASEWACRPGGTETFSRTLASGSQSNGHILAEIRKSNATPVTTTRPYVRAFYEFQNHFSTASPKAQRISWKAGDKIIVAGGHETQYSSGANTINTPTCTGLTFALKTSQTGVNNSEASNFWFEATAAADGEGSLSVTSTAAGGGSWMWSWVCWVVANPGTTSLLFANYNESTTSAAVTANGLVLYFATDWGAATTYSSPATGSGTGYVRASYGNTNNYAVVAADWENVSAGTFAFGLSSYTGRTVNQIALLVEKVASGNNYTQTPADAIGLTDSISTARALSRTVTDPIGLTDSRVLPHMRTLTDAVGLLDSNAKARSEVFTDSVGVLDSTVRGKSYNITVTDGIGTTDVEPISRGIVRTDTLGLADVSSRVRQLVRTLTDALGLTDATTRAKAVTKALTDLVGLTDVADPVKTVGGTNHTRIFTDAVGLLDAIARAVGLARTDGIGTTDLRASTYGETRSDAVGLLDAASRTTTTQRTITDVVGLLDASTKASSTNRTATDAVGLTDSITTANAGADSYTASDPVGLTDSIALNHNKVRSVTDAVGLTDSTTRPKIISKIVVDGVGTTDLRTDAQGYNRAHVETIGIADTASRVKSWIRTMTDSIGLTDPINTTAAGNDTASATDPIGITELVVRVLTWVRSLTDAIGLGDSTTRSRGINRTITDSVGVTDGISRQRKYERTHTEAVGVVDLWSRTAAWRRVQNESIGAHDDATVRTRPPTLYQDRPVRPAKRRIGLGPDRYVAKALRSVRQIRRRG